MKKKTNKIIWITLSILIILSVIFVSSTYSARQSIVGTEPQEGVSLNYPVCINQNYICKTGAIYTGETTTYGNYIYLCDIDNKVKCPQEKVGSIIYGGCTLKPNSIKSSEGICADATKEVPIPDCTEDYMQCGIGSTEDPTGDIYRCENGQWEIYDENDGTQVCEELSAYKAVFQEEFWYCIGVAGNIYLRDKASAQNIDVCYETLEEAKANIQLCCYNPEADTYIWRKSSCLDSELYRLGTNIDEDWCKEQNKNNNVAGEENCLIEKWWGATDPFGNYPCFIKNPVKTWWFWTGLVALVLGIIIFAYKKLLRPIFLQVIVGYGIIVAIVFAITYVLFNGINLGLFRIGG